MCSDYFSNNAFIWISQAAQQPYFFCLSLRSLGFRNLHLYPGNRAGLLHFIKLLTLKHLASP